MPADWAEGLAPFDRAALEEQARWFFLRDGRAAVDARLAGEWADDGTLLAAVGEFWVRNQGCFSCHEIGGMETMMPIGTELTNWGSKTIDKLDFGFWANHVADEKGWDLQTDEFYDWKQLKSYREPWLEQKLHAPRSFDKDKDKGPLDKLKMPWFDLTEEEVKSIATFVVGLVDDEVQLARMKPTPEQAQMDKGLRAIRQKNCAGCHQIDPGEIAWTDDAGEAHRAKAEILTLEGWEWLGNPPLDQWDRVQTAYEAEVREYEGPDWTIEELYVRLLGSEPGVGDIGETIYFPANQITEVVPPWGGGLVWTVTDTYQNPWAGERGKTHDYDEGTVYDVDGVARNYQALEYDKARWTFAPPVLWDEGNKVRREWFVSFLHDPHPIREQIRVKMPKFNYGPGEAGAIADYFAAVSEERWPSRYARRLRVEQGLSLEDVADGAGLTPEAVAQIEAGSRPETEAKFADLHEWGAGQGFELWPAVDQGNEYVLRRTTSYLEALGGIDADHFDMATQLAIDPDTGVNCLQCHWLDGVPPNADPEAWAPDLARVRERLREDWVHEWVRDPAKIYPGTAMPKNFDPALTQWQDAYPGTAEEQVLAILDWLFNLDKIDPVAQ